MKTKLYNTFFEKKKRDNVNITCSARCNIQVSNNCYINRMREGATEIS